MPSAADMVAASEATIARARERLAAAQREYKAFQRTLTGRGYRDDAEYRKANELAGRVFDLKRTIKNEQKNKRTWQSVARYEAKRGR